MPRDAEPGAVRAATAAPRPPATPSVADLLRAEDRTAGADLTPAGRVALALALGARDLDLFRAGQTPTPLPEEARRQLEVRRQAGRRPSRAPAAPGA